jgi:hypothetical protein
VLPTIFLSLFQQFFFFFSVSESKRTISLSASAPFILTGGGLKGSCVVRDEHTHDPTAAACCARAVCLVVFFTGLSTAQPRPHTSYQPPTSSQPPACTQFIFGALFFKSALFSLSLF